MRTTPGCRLLAVTPTCRKRPRQLLSKRLNRMLASQTGRDPHPRVVFFSLCRSAKSMPATRL